MTKSNAPPGVSAALHTLLADNFVTYFKVHTYHFSVQGTAFAQDHGLLNEIYDFLWASHDTFGEVIRQMDDLPCQSLKEILAETCLKEITTPKILQKDIFDDVANDIASLMDVAQDLYNISSDCGACQTVVGDYMVALSKLHWKVRATIGRSIK